MPAAATTGDDDVRNADVEAHEGETLAGGGGGAPAPAQVKRSRWRRGSKPGLPAKAQALALLQGVSNACGVTRNNYVVRLVTTWALRLVFVAALLTTLSYSFVVTGVSSMVVSSKSISPSLTEVGREVYSLLNVYANATHTAICDGDDVRSDHVGSRVDCTEFLHKSPSGTLFDALSGSEEGTAWAEIAAANPMQLLRDSLHMYPATYSGCTRVPGETVVVPADTQNYFHLIMRVLYFLHKYDMGVWLADDAEVTSHLEIISADSLYIPAPLGSVPSEYLRLLANFTHTGTVLGSDSLQAAPLHMLCFDELVPRVVRGFGVDTEEVYTPDECAYSEDRQYIITLAQRLRLLLDAPQAPSLLGDEDSFFEEDGSEDEPEEGPSVQPSAKPSPVGTARPPPPICCSFTAAWANGSVLDLNAVQDAPEGGEAGAGGGFDDDLDPGNGGGDEFSGDNSSLRMLAVRRRAQQQAATSPSPAPHAGAAGTTCVKLSHVCTREHPLLLLHRSQGPRLLANEAEVVAALRAAGAFVTVADFGAPGTTVKQQVAAASSACMLLGMHGAALTNMIFLADELEYLVMAARGGAVAVSETLLAPVEGTVGANGSISTSCNLYPPGTIVLDVSAAQASIAAGEDARDPWDNPADDDIENDDSFDPNPNDDLDGGDGDGTGDEGTRRAAAAPVRGTTAPLLPGRRRALDAAPTYRTDLCLPGWNITDELLRDSAADLAVSDLLLHPRDTIDFDSEGGLLSSPSEPSRGELVDFVEAHSGGMLLSLTPPVIELFGHLLHAEQTADPLAPPLAVYYNLACATGKLHSRHIGLPNADGAKLDADIRNRPATVAVDALVDDVLSILSAGLSILPIDTCDIPGGGGEDGWDRRQRRVAGERDARRRVQMRSGGGEVWRARAATPSAGPVAAAAAGAGEGGRLPGAGHQAAPPAASRLRSGSGKPQH